MLPDILFVALPLGASLLGEILSRRTLQERPLLRLAIGIFAFALGLALLQWSGQILKWQSSRNHLSPAATISFFSGLLLDALAVGTIVGVLRVPSLARWVLLMIAVLGTCVLYVFVALAESGDI